MSGEIRPPGFGAGAWIEMGPGQFAKIVLHPPRGDEARFDFLAGFIGAAEVAMEDWAAYGSASPEVKREWFGRLNPGAPLPTKLRGVA